MIKAVVKHTYVKGATGMAKGWAHIKYIQFRSRDEREEGPRRFFNEDREGIRGEEIKRELDEQERYGVQMHKLILSPGLEGTDLEAYTRETMTALEREKGRDLVWYGVIHRNTDHEHIHVVVMGLDKEGGRVRFGRDDYKQVRETGDRYLEREHKLERYLDREIDRLLAAKDWRHDRGDREYERLMYGDRDGADDSKRRDRDAERDRREWEELDRDLHKTFKRERGLEPKKGYRQWNLEQAGRLSDFHERYWDKQTNEYWKELAERYPGSEGAARELAYIEKLEQEAKLEKYGERDLDKLLDGMEPYERELQRDLDRERESC